MNTKYPIPAGAAFLLAATLFAAAPVSGQTLPATPNPAVGAPPESIGTPATPPPDELAGLPADTPGLPGRPLPAAESLTPGATPAPAPQEEVRPPGIDPSPNNVAAPAPGGSSPPATASPSRIPNAPRRGTTVERSTTPGGGYAGEPPAMVPAPPGASGNQWRKASGPGNRYYSTPQPAPLEHSFSRADQILRDTKLKVLQRHYESALSELVETERALIDAADDKRPAMETRLKGLKGFVEKLEADIQKLAAAQAPDAAPGTDYGPRSGAGRVRTSASPWPPAGTPELPNDPGGRAVTWERGGGFYDDAPLSKLPDGIAEESLAPPRLRVPAPRGKIVDREGREIPFPPKVEAAEPDPWPAPARGR